VRHITTGADFSTGEVRVVVDLPRVLSLSVATRGNT
jgi:hypothetical protein